MSIPSYPMSLSLSEDFFATKIIMFCNESCESLIKFNYTCTVMTTGPCI